MKRRQFIKCVFLGGASLFVPLPKIESKSKILKGKSLLAIICEAVEDLERHGVKPQVILCHKWEYETLRKELRERALFGHEYRNYEPRQIWMVSESGDIPVYWSHVAPKDRIFILPDNCINLRKRGWVLHRG